MTFDWLPDLGFSEPLLFFLRIIATVGAAVVGWFLSDPLTRGLYWLVRRATVPALLLFSSKSLGAITLAVLTFIAMQFVNFGGGGGGWGLGPGAGGLPGKGPGQGGGDAVPNTKDNKTKPDSQKGSRALEPIEIEIISDKLYKNDEKYFLVQRKEPAFSRSELDDYLKKNKDKIEVIPILTGRSIGIGGEDSPLSQLQGLTEKHNVRTMQPKRL